MNRAQQAILLVGALVIVVLFAVGSWTFTSSVESTAATEEIPSRSTTWTETSSCSILFGARGHEAPGRPLYLFSVPACEAFDAWREPVLAGIGAAALLTALGVLWSATARARPDAELTNPANPS